MKIAFADKRHTYKHTYIWEESGGKAAENRVEFECAMEMK